MKKIIIKIYTLFYLLTSFGFVSARHYCDMTQQSMQQSSTDSCCVSSEPVTTKECHTSLPDSVQESCCNVVKYPLQPEPMVHDERARADCCETQLDLHHFETSTLSKDVNVADGMVLAPNFVDIATKQPHFAHNSLITATDPSFHHNLPLLI